MFALAFDVCPQLSFYTVHISHTGPNVFLIPSHITSWASGLLNLLSFVILWSTYRPESLLSKQDAYIGVNSACKARNNYWFHNSKRSHSPLRLQSTVLFVDSSKFGKYLLQIRFLAALTYQINDWKKIQYLKRALWYHSEFFLSQ